MKIDFEAIIAVLIKIQKSALSIDQNYFFISKLLQALRSQEEFFAHVISSNFVVVQVRNTTTMSYYVLKNFKIDRLMNYFEDECFLIKSKEKHLTIMSHNNTNSKKALFIAKIEDLKNVFFNDIIAYDDDFARR
jgi:hypothetical protein